MLSNAYSRYCALESRLEQDEEYLALKHRLDDISPSFESAVAQLSPEDQACITEYIGILSEIQQRITELAAFME